MGDGSNSANTCRHRPPGIAGLGVHQQTPTANQDCSWLAAGAAVPVERVRVQDLAAPEPVPVGC